MHIQQTALILRPKESAFESFLVSSSCRAFESATVEVVVEVEVFIMVS